MNLSQSFLDNGFLPFAVDNMYQLDGLGSAQWPDMDVAWVRKEEKDAMLKEVYPF